MTALIARFAPDNTTKHTARRPVEVVVRDGHLTFRLNEVEVAELYLTLTRAYNQMREGATS